MACVEMTMIRVISPDLSNSNGCHSPTSLLHQQPLVGVFVSLRAHFLRTRLQFVCAPVFVLPLELDGQDEDTSSSLCLLPRTSFRGLWCFVILRQI